MKAAKAARENINIAQLFSFASPQDLQRADHAEKHFSLKETLCHLSDSGAIDSELLQTLEYCQENG